MNGGGGFPAPHHGARAGAIQSLLDGAGFGVAVLSTLGADASFRRYARLTGGPRPALLMDAPPEKEDVRPWLAVARHLRALGFSAPEVFAADEDAGLLLIEDFGDDTFSRALAQGGGEAALYDLAVDVLAALHEVSRADALPGWLPPYDDDRLLDEAALFTDWYMPEALGVPTPPESRVEFLSLWRAALPPARALPQTLVLRDYHVGNLMLLADRQGIAACGLLDFQDAVAGAGAYDVVSLIRDARRDLGPGIAARVKARYLERFPGLDRADFEAASAVLAAGRAAKIIGIFTRLWKRDGKPAYLAHIPRVWQLLEADLGHPALAPLRAWFANAVPPAKRTMPGPRGGAR